MSGATRQMRRALYSYLDSQGLKHHTLFGTSHYLGETRPPDLWFYVTPRRDNSLDSSTKRALIREMSRVARTVDPRASVEEMGAEANVDPNLTGTFGVYRGRNDSLGVGVYLGSSLDENGATLRSE